MDRKNLTRHLEEELTEVPLLDAHSHLVGGKLAARGLHDILLYHMGISELYAAGCPSGRRLSEFPLWPDRKEAHSRLQEAIPFLTKTRNSSISWCARIILSDLYGWTDPITEDNWEKLDAKIRERADDRAWQHSILDRSNIQRTATEWARREGSIDNSRLQYVLEWAMFARSQWGEFDTAVYELERCWGKSPESPAPIGAGRRPPAERTIKKLEDVHEAMKHYISHLPLEGVLGTALTFSTEINYDEVSDGEMASALARRHEAGSRERDIYASYINDAFLTALGDIGDRFVYQFALGGEPLPFETASIVPQKTIAQLGQIIARHPRVKFQCFLASRHSNQSLCTLARELPNLSLAGYWWHNFFPDAIQQVMAERLEMLPLNRQIGFFSDAYCAEWSYAKAVLVRKMLAKVLTEKLEDGQYTLNDARSIAEEIFFQSPQSLLRMSPRKQEAI